MRIGKPLALVIGLLTIWPIIYMFLFMASIAIAIAGGFGQQQSPGFFPYLFVAHIVTMLIMFCLMAFYIVHVFKNAALKDDRRVLWAVVLFMGGPIAAPVYWWLFIWSRQQNTTTAGASVGNANV
jgi:hypothetical protein